MRLYFMEDEVSIAGSVSELQDVKARIEAMDAKDSIRIDFDASGSSQGFGILLSSMTISAGLGPAIAEYKEGQGIVVSGGLESLLVFASFFDFDENAKLGSHYHWDEFCDSDFVDSETLPIVVAVA